LLALLRAASYLEMEVWVRFRVRVRVRARARAWASSIARGLEVWVRS
jgi:hypothetical protein